MTPLPLGGFTQGLYQSAGAVWDYLYNIPFAFIFSLLHDVFVALDIGLFVGIVYVLIELAPFRPKFVNNPRKLIVREKRVSTLANAELTAKWKHILEKAESAPPQSLTLAIIEADSFVDDILKQLGYQGEHMADRLDKISAVDSLDGLWKAHRVRNDVVHTPGYQISPADARRFLNDYEAFLKEMGVLE